MEKQHDYFFSFSLDGKNQGIINTTADSEENATNHLISLGIMPKSDDIRVFELEVGAEELENDRVYSPEELKNLNYKKVNY